MSKQECNILVETLHTLGETDIDFLFGIERRDEFCCCELFSLTLVPLVKIPANVFLLLLDRSSGPDPDVWRDMACTGNQTHSHTQQIISAVNKLTKLLSLAERSTSSII